jgi:hypothetical protein
MKLIPSSLLIAMFSINTLLYAQTLPVESNDVMAQELRKQSARWNMNLIEYWTNLGVTDTEEIEKWKLLYQNFLDNYKLPEYSIKNSYKPAYFIAKGFTPETTQLWIDNGIELEEIGGFLEIGIDTYQEAKLWKDILPIYIVKTYVQSGIKDPLLLRKMKDIVGSIEEAGMIIRNGITNPEEVKILKDKGFEIDEIALIIKNNLSLNVIKEWRENDIKDIKEIVILVSGGFENPKKYLPYKNIDKDHAIKLYKWGIKPNKLIESMSRSDRVLFKKELFFKNQERFVSFYDKLNNANCSEIINNYFTNIDMSKNKNQCLMFIGNMIQRLDEKSFFGKITQKGLVNDMTKKNFYVESFDGDWLENEYKIGVIKGNEFFNYESKIGKQVIPKGTVIILDALDTLDKW